MQTYHEHHEHHEHPYINKYAINTFLAHLSVLCYTIFHFYILIETKDKNFINHKITYSNKNQLIFLIKTKLKFVFNEEIIFRVFLVEIMALFMNHNIIHPIWSIIFAFYYFKTYKYNTIIRIANFINMFIVSYFVLINVPFLVSLFIHCYLELFSIAFNKFLYSNFEIKLNNIPKKIELSANVKSVLNKHNLENNFSSSELASKEEVEELLSNKKMD
jgi:hypothetical protein